MVLSKKVIYLILGFIILFSAIVRTVNIQNIPQGFHSDEAAYGYNSYSLLLSGRDEYGKFFPTTLKSFDDYKSALYAYYSAPFIFLFGLNEFSVRVPSAIVGTLFVLVSFFLTLRLTKKESISLVVAGLMSISPILILVSRVQSDPLLGSFLAFCGIYFFITWVQKKNYLYLAGALFLFVLSLMSNQSPKVFIPIFLPFLFLCYFKEIKNKDKTLLAVLYLILLFFVGYFSFTGGARVQQTSVFTKPDVQLLVDESIREEGSEMPVIITRIFNNKPYYYSRALLDNYFSYLSFDFLFSQGELPAREKIKNFGFLYLVDLPFLILGLFQTIKKKNKWGYIALGWILITPLVFSPFIEESPNLHRFLFALYPFVLLTAFGISEFINFFKKKKIFYYSSIVFIFSIYIFSFVYFIHQLFINQPVHKPWARNHSYKELIFSLRELEPKYSKFVISSSESDVYIYYLFYNKFNPKKYQELGSFASQKNAQFGKYHFLDELCPFNTGKEGKDKFVGEPGVLYINNGACIDPKFNAKTVKIIRWGDGSPSFKFLEYVPDQIMNEKE